MRLPAPAPFSGSGGGNSSEDSEPERLNAAEPLVDPSAELSKKARKLRKRGEQVLSAAQAAAAVAADLATTAAEETAAAQAAAQEEVASTAAQLAGDVASDAADVAASVQAAAKAAQQQAEEALAGAAAAAAGTSSSTGGAAAGSNAGSKLQGKLSAPQPAAGELAAPEPPAGELQAPEQPVAALPPAGATGGSGGGGGDAAADAEVEAGKRAAQLAHTKEQLVHMLASLDRGAAATDDQMDRVDALVRRLEALGGPVTLSWDRSAAGGPSSMALLDGRWRLLYSSGFSSGSLGGRRPGPSFGGGPFTLGQVYQDIFTDKEELDNCVDLFLRYSLAALPGMGGATPAASARLRHTFSVQGANTVEITFTDTEVKLAGGLQGWLDSLPRFTVPSLPEWLQPPKRLRFARFDVVYLDSEMRVTRGDRGELRVFLKGMA
ncbi:putative plastid-lipid-associated chloroplastic [Micractinium conductrix]|uniref:Plastid-lipid-associated chloroplastic n=1 Tax=Micractinium conductrix TaxID=554055 RepID=A0A2P6V5V4_9CHLO|nr:putative plastid-lipid-associated chloroplastic [Micractinium conductrix]|eukprot:PSC69468.1 putative plastid-lipid-associated chloroplastic [Micractinium conductrix]